MEDSRFVPSGWSVQELQAISSVVDPNPTHRNPEYVREGFPFISTAEFIEPDGVLLETPRRVGENTVREQEARCQFTEGSIAFSRKGTIGKTRVLPNGIRFALLDSVCVVNPNRQTVVPRFLNHALRSDFVRKQIILASMGVALQQISVGRVRSLRVLLPTLPEQRRIAAILSAVDEAIAGTQAIIEQLQVVKKAMMAELLTRGIPGRHTRFKMTKIGEVPEAWDVVQLSELAKIVDPNPSHRYPPDVADGVPLVSTANFWGTDGYTLADAPRVPVETFDEQNGRCAFLEDDVVFARKGRIGFARPYGQERKVFSHTVVTFKANRERLLPAFLLWIARSGAFLSQLERTMNTNSGVPTLGVKIIGGTWVPVPSLSEQRMISDGLQATTLRRGCEEQTLAALGALKSALMSVLLTGEVRVQPDEDAA